MQINETLIEDTFAEGFTMRYARLIVTALDEYWLNAGLAEFCGYGTSVIGCDAEVGIESRLSGEMTPDGRIGASVLAFGFSADALGKAMVNRTGQCLMTCPTTAVFDGFGPTAQSSSATNSDQETKEAKGAENPDKSDRKPLPLGQSLRFFGDGFQKSKLLQEFPEDPSTGESQQRRFWRIPVMDGEFIVEDMIFADKGVAGGNFLIQSVDQASGLAAARRSIEAIQGCPGVITPFPAGVVRSGSKVGSKYKQLVASTYDAYCPTLRGQVETKIHPEANCVYEIVIDGVDFDHVAKATRAGILAATHSNSGIKSIGAGNYGGSLGPHHFKLHEICG